MPIKAPPGYKLLTPAMRSGSWMYMPGTKDAVARKCAARFDASASVVRGSERFDERARRRMLDWLEHAKLPVEDRQDIDVLAGMAGIGVTRWPGGVNAPVHVGAMDPKDDGALAGRPCLVAQLRNAGNNAAVWSGGGAWVRELDAFTSSPVGRPMVFGSIDASAVVKIGIKTPRRALILTRDVVSAMVLHLASGLTAWAVMGDEAAWRGFELIAAMLDRASAAVIYVAGSYSIDGKESEANADLIARLSARVPWGAEGLGVKSLSLERYAELMTAPGAAGAAGVLDRDWTDGGERITWAHFARALGRDWRTLVGEEFANHDELLTEIDARWAAGAPVIGQSEPAVPGGMKPVGTGGTRGGAITPRGAGGGAGVPVGALQAWEQNVEEAMPIIEDAPLTRARRFLWEKCRSDTPGRRFGLVRWAGDWWVWVGSRYVQVTEEVMRSIVWEWLNGFRTLDRADIVPLNPDDRAVTTVIKALAVDVAAHGTMLPMWLPPTMTEQGLPMWGAANALAVIAGNSEAAKGRPSPGTLLAFPNGVIDLNELKPGWGARIAPHTTDLFNTAVLPFDLPIDELNDLLSVWEDEDLKRGIYQRLCPTWMRFVTDIANGDEDYPGQLQCMMGDTISGDRSIEKIYAVGGKSRGGKGVIEEAVALVTGENNVESFSLAQLSDRFALAPFIGKKAAISPDAHLDQFAKGVGNVEILKSISGQGRVQVRDLYKPAQTIKLGVRFWMFYNEEPDLRDDSAAFAGRFVILPITKGYAGREDESIKRNVPLEGPGIMLWAIEGAIRLALMEHRRIPLCQSSIGASDEFSRISAHVKAFVEDVLVTDASRAAAGDGEHSGDPLAGLEGAKASDVYGAYEWWCSKVEHKTPVGQGKFWRKLKLQLPDGVTYTQPRGVDGARPRIIDGVSIKPSVVKQIAIWKAAGGASSKQAAIPYGRDDSDDWQRRD